MLQFVRVRDSSSTLMTTGATVPLTTGPGTSRHIRNVESSPMFTTDSTGSSIRELTAMTLLCVLGGGAGPAVLSE